jgi:hypothetical protein
VCLLIKRRHSYWLLDLFGLLFGTRRAVVSLDGLSLHSVVAEVLRFQSFGVTLLLGVGIVVSCVDSHFVVDFEPNVVLVNKVYRLLQRLLH